MSRRPDPQETIREVEALYERFGISQNTRQVDISPTRTIDGHVVVVDDGRVPVPVYQYGLSQNTHVSRRK